MTSSRRPDARVISIIVSNFIFAMAIEFCRHLTYNPGVEGGRRASDTVYVVLPRILNELLTEIHTEEKSDYIKP